MKATFPPPAVNFTMPVYGGRVFMFKTETAMKKALDYLHADYACENLGGCCVQIDVPGGSVIYLVGWFTGDFSTLVHECGHLAMYVMSRAGIDVRNDGGEAYCYLLGDIVDRMGIDKKPRAKSAR